MLISSNKKIVYAAAIAILSSSNTDIFTVKTLPYFLRHVNYIETDIRAETIKDTWDGRYSKSEYDHDELSLISNNFSVVVVYSLLLLKHRYLFSNTYRH